MSTFSKIKSGAIARHNGLLFENMILFTAAKQGFKSIQIPLGAKQLKRNLIRVKTPFDFVLYKNGKTISLDAKSTIAETFAFSSITPHQLQNLAEIESQGCPAGYLVYFSTLNKVCFFSAANLLSISKKSSLGPKNSVFLGPLETMELHLIFEYYRQQDRIPTKLPA